MAALPAESRLAAAVLLLLAAGALPFPLHADSSEAPPAAAANRRNVRRPGDPLAVRLPGSPPSFPASAIAARLPFAVLIITLPV